MINIDKELETKTLSQVLAENLAYYVEDPSRRCKNNERATCYYSPKNAGNDKSEGCFIGRFLNEQQQLELDIIESAWDEYIIREYNEARKNNPEYFKALPKALINKKYMPIFYKFQNFHDTSIHNYWSDKGLSDIGKYKLIEIINDFPNYLKREDFELLLK